MSFFSQGSATAARNRRPKEREGHPRGTSGRRHRTSSKSQENRTSPPSKSPTLSSSTLYAQQNVGLDQLPPLPPSEATTPAFTSPSSSVHQAQPAASRQAGVLHLNQQVYTPANLQQYLDVEEDDSEDTTSEEDEENDTEAISSSQTSTVAPPSKPPVEAPLLRSTSEFSTGKTISNVIKHQQALRSPDRNSDDDTPRADQQPTRTIYFNPPAKDSGAVSQLPSSTRISRQNSHDAAKSVEHVDKSTTDDTIPPMPQSAAEHYYKGSNTPSSQTPPSRAAGLRRSRPFSQIVSSNDARDLPRDLPEQIPTMTRTMSQQSGPLLTRAFTPPAPPTGASRAPAQTPPVYMSPVPIRARMTGEGYGAYYPPSAYNAQRQSLHTGQPDPYHMPGAFQNAPETMPLGYLQASQSFSQLPGTPQSSMPEIKQIQSHSSESHEDHVTLLAKLHTALPHIQMILAHSQLSAHNGSSTSSELIQIRGATNEELEEQKTKYNLLEIKHLEVEHHHNQTIQALLIQVAELQAKVKYLEDDITHQRKSRDKMHEDLVMERMEASMTVKTLMDEREDLRRKHDQVKLATNQEIQGKVKALDEELAGKTKTIEDLQSHLTQTQAMHTAQIASTKATHEETFNSLLEKHNQTTSSLQERLDEAKETNESLSKQLEEMPYRLNEERARMSERFNADISDMKKAHQVRMESLEEAFRSEKARNSNLLEEMQNMGKQLETARSHAANHKARYVKASSDFKSAATKMNEENQNLQKIIEAFGEASDRSRGPSPS